MRLQQFSDAVDGLFAYFQRKQPESSVKRLWFEHVQDIPGESVPWILKHIERTCDGLPRNIGKSFRDAFEIWQKENPEKLIKYQRVMCGGCGKEGFLFFRKYDEELKHSYSFVARCGSCENWICQTSKNSGVPIYTRETLEKMGVQFEDFG